MATTVAEVQAKLELATGKFSAQVATAQAATRSLGSNMHSSLGSATDGIKSKLSQLGSAALAFAKTAGIAVGAVMAGWGVASIKSASGMEQNRIAFETMLGSAEKAGRMLKDIEAFALKTPFNLPQVVEGAKSLLAYGIAGDKIIPTFSMLGNIAAGVGRDKLPQLVLAFGQVRAAGRLTGMELRQFTEAGVPLLEELAKQSGKSAAQIKDDMERGIAPSFEDVERALGSLTGEGGRFFNLMDKQSKSLGGIFSNIVDSIGKVGRAIIGMNSQGEVAEGSIFDRLRSGAAAFQQFLAAHEQDFVRFGTVVVNGISIAVSFLAQVFRAVLPYLTAIWNVMVAQLVPIFQQFWVAIQPLLPLLADAAKIFGVVLVAAIIAFVAVVAIVIVVLAKIVTGFVQVVSKIVQVWNDGWYAVGFIIQRAVDFVIGVWNGIKAVVGIIVSVMGSVVSAIRNGLDNARNWVIGFIGSFFSLGRDLVMGIARGIRNAASAVIDAITGVVGDGIDWAKRKLGIKSPSKVFMEFGRNISEGLAIGITQGSGMVTGALNSISALNPSLAHDAINPGAGTLVQQIYPKSLTNRDMDMVFERGEYYRNQSLRGAFR